MHWTERDSLHHHSNYRAFLLHYWVSRSSASLGRPQRRERERTRPVSPRWWALRWQPPPYIKALWRLSVGTAFPQLSTKSSKQWAEAVSTLSLPNGNEGPSALVRAEKPTWNQGGALGPNSCISAGDMQTAASHRSIQFGQRLVTPNTPCRLLPHIQQPNSSHPPISTPHFCQQSNAEGSFLWCPFGRLLAGHSQEYYGLNIKSPLNLKDAPGTISNAWAS